VGCLKLQSDYFNAQNRYRAFSDTPKKSLYGDFQTGKVGYNFDNIGNRNTSTYMGQSKNYTSNNLNQYTMVDTQSPTYDNDGNMLTNGDWAYTWNAENRLIEALKTDQKLEFKYDYMGRRVEKKVTDKVGTVWTLNKHEYFVYDGYKLIEKLDALNSSNIAQKFLWSGETILSMNDANGTYYYLIDANKNVGQLLDSSGTIKAKYEYSPFGKLTSSSDTVSNPFRFSSEYFDGETELVYYNYRYYDAGLGRWLSRDPIWESGGWNLYGLLDNDAVNWWDYLGNGKTSSRVQGLVKIIKKYKAMRTKAVDKVDDARRALNTCLTNVARCPCKKPCGDNRNRYEGFTSKCPNVCKRERAALEGAKAHLAVIDTVIATKTAELAALSSTGIGGKIVGVWQWIKNWWKGGEEK